MTAIARAVVAVLAGLLVLGSAGASAQVGARARPEARSGSAPAEITVAAASDLRFAFDELAERFERQTGTEVVLTYGSSGLLAGQVQHGAPFDVFASADASLVDDVVRSGRGARRTKATYAFGRIVVWTRADAAPPPPRLRDLAASRFARIAIANPAHAPYGRAAHQALQAAGILTAVERRLVYGENVSDALRIAQSGNADAAIVALSLAVATPGGEYSLIPERLHEPLEQALVVTAPPDRRPAAKAFARLVSQDPAGRAIMRRYGFVLPDERAPRRLA